MAWAASATASSSFDACASTSAYPSEMSSAYASYNRIGYAYFAADLSAYEDAGGVCAAEAKSFYSLVVSDTWLCSATRSVWEYVLLHLNIRILGSLNPPGTCLWKTCPRSRYFAAASISSSVLAVRLSNRFCQLSAYVLCRKLL